MSLEKQKNWLRLALTPGMQFESFYGLLKAFGLPEAIFSQSLSSLMTVLPQSMALSLRRTPSPQTDDQIERILHFLSSVPNARLLVPSDEDFPKKFLMVPQPPLVTLAVGHVALLNKTTVSLVGSSHPSAQGEEIAKSWAGSLVRKNVALVEGDGEGIENAALKSAIKSNAQSLVIVSKNIVNDSNFFQKSLFVSKRGLLLSPIEMQNDPWPSRQRLLLAGVEHFVVIEASARSKVLSLMREAADINRNILAVPGSIYSPLSKGTNRLIREGAKLVESVDDILSEVAN